LHGRTVWSMQRCVWWDAVGDLQVQNGTARICREVRARRRAQKIAAGCLSPRTGCRTFVRVRLALGTKRTTMLRTKMRVLSMVLRCVLKPSWSSEGPL
jgi:hypothetical protein